MLRAALLLFILALVAGLFGFNLIAGVSWELGKILFFVFLVLAILAIVSSAFRSPTV